MDDISQRILKINTMSYTVQICVCQKNVEKKQHTTRYKNKYSFQRPEINNHAFFHLTNVSIIVLKQFFFLMTNIKKEFKTKRTYQPQQHGLTLTILTNNKDGFFFSFWNQASISFVLFDDFHIHVYSICYYRHKLFLTISYKSTRTC